LEGEIYFGIDYLCTISGSCLHFCVDHLKKALPGLPFREVVCGFAFNFKLIHQLNNFKMIEKIENLSEFNQSALSIFTIARISLVDEWSKKDYVEPNNEVKELLSICGIAT